MSVLIKISTTAQYHKVRCSDIRGLYLKSTCVKDHLFGQLVGVNL